MKHMHSPFERRHLPQVLAELKAAEADWQKTWGTPQESAALDRITELQKEARARVVDMTGVSVDELRGL